MVDPTFNLGRSVPTAREVLEVIRPQLRLGAVIGPVVVSTFSSSQFVAPGQDEESSLGGDDYAALDVLLLALRDDAVRNVKQWASDVDKVFDGAALVIFISEALGEVVHGVPSDAVLDVLDLDEGVCEAIGMSLKLLAAPTTLDYDEPHDKALAGMAACYFQRV